MRKDKNLNELMDEVTFLVRDYQNWVKESGTVDPNFGMGTPQYKRICRILYPILIELAERKVDRFTATTIVGDKLIKLLNELNTNKDFPAEQTLDKLHGWINNAQIDEHRKKSGRKRIEIENSSSISISTTGTFSRDSKAEFEKKVVTHIDVEKFVTVCSKNGQEIYKIYKAGLEEKKPWERIGISKTKYYHELQHMRNAIPPIYDHSKIKKGEV